MKLQPHFRGLFLVLAVIILLSPLIYWLTGVRQIAHQLSAALVHQPDGTLLSSPKAQALHSLTLPMRLERLVIYPLLLLAFQLSGGAVVLRQRLEHYLAKSSAAPSATSRLNRSAVLVILLFFLIFETTLALLNLPFDFYGGFILMHQFGLSTQTTFGWLSDWLKSLLIALITGGLLWVGFYLLIRLFPRRWPIPAGAALLVLGFVFTMLTPILITPLFYQVRPLEDAALATRIINLTNRAGMQVDQVEVIDASAKTTTVNAYFTGFGRDRRIVLYDTLLHGYTPDQIEVVLAHEMGHWYYQHVFWSVLGLGLVGWLGLFGLRWLLNRSWRLLGLHSPADVAGLPYVLAVVAIATMLSLPFQNTISRYAERQADWFALTTSQKPAAFIELFGQFAMQNLSMVDTAAWEKFIFYTHPPIVKRIQMAEDFQKKLGEQFNPSHQSKN